ncbi:hypothetical protein FNV43_RR25458 [Rhamnella rubrinervis]|uniref:Uncharacterized protein n=1 Tax=Rhamnella rubrinervis TaxID=2594499 RepID=A0A8K0DV50_9ROSA|nr:hypothetical protein FNV43_RR25458 [Rhamnella rubrinervis]
MISILHSLANWVGYILPSGNHTKEATTPPAKTVAQDHKASQSLSPPKVEAVASDSKPQKGQQQPVEKQQPKQETKVQDQGLPPKAANLDAENYGKQKNDHKGIGDDHPLSSTWEDQEGYIAAPAAKDSKQKDIGIISDKTQILDHGKAKANKDEREGKVSVFREPKEGSSSSRLPKKKKHKESDTASINMRGSAEKGIEPVAEEKATDEDEQRKLAVNIGAAVLVLVAFGGYLSYSLFGSFGKTKNQ